MSNLVAASAIFGQGQQPQAPTPQPTAASEAASSPGDTMTVEEAAAVLAQQQAQASAGEDELPFDEPAADAPQTPDALQIVAQGLAQLAENQSTFQQQMTAALAQIAEATAAARAPAPAPQAEPDIFEGLDPDPALKAALSTVLKRHAEATTGRAASQLEQRLGSLENYLREQHGRTQREAAQAQRAAEIRALAETKKFPGGAGHELLDVVARANPTFTAEQVVSKARSLVTGTVRAAKPLTPTPPALTGKTSVKAPAKKIAFEKVNDLNAIINNMLPQGLQLRGEDND